MGLEYERLLSLIDFARESAKLKDSPVYDVASHNMFHEYEHNLQGLPGLHFNVNYEGDEIWLVVDRLRETNSPIAKNPLLSLWLEVSNNPEKKPFLKDSVEFSKLLDPRFIVLEKDSDHINIDKLVLLHDFAQASEVESQLNAYIITQWTLWAEEEKKRRRNIQFYAKLFTLKQQLEGAITDSPLEVAWGVGKGQLHEKFIW